MRKRTKGVWARLVLLLAVVALALTTSACSKRRTVRVPIPPAYPGQTSRAETPPSSLPKEKISRAPGQPAEYSLQPPRECQISPHPPWWRCLHQSETGESLVYYLYLPRQNHGGTASLPLVTFLHGSSGSGPGDGKPVTGGHRHGSNLWIRETVQEQYPSIVLAPQAQPAPGETWVRTWRAPSPGDTSPKEALVLVHEVISKLSEQLPVDRRRLYLTGQSMGGFGAWLAYTRYPGQFAAIVPVCGGGDVGAVTRNSTAVWAFHGDNDRVVPVSRSREMVEAIRSLNGNVRYTEYSGLGHNIFERVYSEPDLVEWLFSQRLETEPPLE
jgi:predicted peptidase